MYNLANERPYCYSLLEHRELLYSQNNEAGNAPNVFVPCL